MAPPRKKVYTKKEVYIYTDTPENERIEQITPSKIEKIRINEERKQALGRKRKFDLEE